MPRSFLTGLYGFFLPDPKSAKLVFSFAKGGHPPPIHFDAGSGKSRFIKTKGTLIGEFPHIKIEEKKVELNIGDRLFLYTDGFPETFNGEKKMLGFDEILNVVDKSHDPDLSNSMDKILARIDIFREGEPLSDDIALIGFEVI
jgi:sigma-B regulation protein RsbU (phosphoserine phosphatase)